MTNKNLERLYEEQKQARRTDTLAVKRSQIKQIEGLLEGLTSKQIEDVIDSLEDIVSKIKGLGYSGYSYTYGYGYSPSLALGLKGTAKEIAELLPRLTKNELDDVLNYIKGILKT